MRVRCSRLAIVGSPLIVNRFDDGHEDVSQSCRDQAILLPRSLDSKFRNSLTENEYRAISMDALIGHGGKSTEVKGTIP